MPQLKNTSSPTSAKLAHLPSRRVNWYEAAVCAVQIELRDYADFLEFYSEFVLGKNNYRIDLLVVKMLSDQPIPKKRNIQDTDYRHLRAVAGGKSLSVLSGQSFGGCLHYEPAY